MMNVALIGMGRWGAVLLRVLNERSRVRWVCNRKDQEALARATRRCPEARATTKVEEVFGDAEVEAVVIATPIATHAALARQALEAGKHVFVEKPLTADPAEAYALVELAARRRRTLFTGQVFLYHPVFEKVRELTRDDPISSAQMTWTQFGTFDEDLCWNFLPHPVSLALALFERAPSQAAVCHRQGMVTACDVVAARLAFGADRECWIEANRCAPTKTRRVTLTTASGRVLGWDGDALFRLEPGRPPEPLSVTGEEPLARELDAFLEGARSGRLLGQDPRHGAAVVEVIHELSGTQHGPVPCR